MTKRVQIEIEEKEFNNDHANRLNNALSQMKQILPDNSMLRGHISGVDGKYEGRIHIQSRIGAFVAKARSRNIFSLIAKLQSKIMRQIVNWREKRVAKKKYLRRKQKFILISD